MTAIFIGIGIIMLGLVSEDVATVVSGQTIDEFYRGDTE